MQPHTAPRAHRTCCVSPRFPGFGTARISSPCAILGAITARLDSGEGETHRVWADFSGVTPHPSPVQTRKVIEPPPSNVPPSRLDIFHTRVPRNVPGLLMSLPGRRNGSPQKSPQHLCRRKWLTTLIGKEAFPWQMCRSVNATGILSDKYTPHISHFS